MLSIIENMVLCQNIPGENGFMLELKRTPIT